MTEPSSAESLAFEIFCVIYRLHRSEWTVIGGATWSQLRVFKNNTTNAYRIISWRPNDDGSPTIPESSVHFRFPLTAQCHTKRKAPDFIRVTDASGMTWGLGFYVQGSSASEPTKLLQVLSTAIESASNSGTTTPNRPGSAAVSGAQSMFSPPMPDREVRETKAEEQPQQTNPKMESLDTVACDSDKPDSSATARQNAAPSSPVATTAVASPANSSTGSSSTGWSCEPVPLAPGAPTSTIYNETVGKLGVLNLYPEKPAKLATASAPGASVSSRARGEMDEFDMAIAMAEITMPNRVVHDSHATFDPKTNRFRGLPDGWEDRLQKQFGVDLALVDLVRVRPYPGRIPRVLRALFALLHANGGAEAEGIFRIAPEGGATSSAKERIDAGVLIGRAARTDEKGLPVFPEEPHTVATLIKVWFRDLPERILEHAPTRDIMDTSTGEQAWAVLRKLPEPYKSTCAYLVDECVRVTANVTINRMSPQNLGIVIGPNLFAPDDSNPMNTLALSQKVAQWLKLAIEYRLENPDCEI